MMLGFWNLFLFVLSVREKLREYFLFVVVVVYFWFWFLRFERVSAGLGLVEFRDVYVVGLGREIRVGIRIRGLVGDVLGYL